jgi:hypothetical protein
VAGYCYNFLYTLLYALHSPANVLEHHRGNSIQFAAIGKFIINNSRHNIIQSSHRQQNFNYLNQPNMITVNMTDKICFLSLVYRFEKRHIFVFEFFYLMLIHIFIHLFYFFYFVFHLTILKEWMFKLLIGAILVYYPEAVVVVSRVPIVVVTDYTRLV